MTAKVLVTGVGGVIGQGIIRSLKMSGHDCSIIAADAQPLSAGLYMGDEAVVLPYAHDKTYIDRVTEICLDKGVDLLLPGIYQDVSALSPYAPMILERCGTKVIVSEPGVLERAEDKWETHRFLCGNGFNCCRTVKGDDDAGIKELVAEKGYPVVLKKRSGHGSKGVHAVHDDDELRYFLSREDDVIVQEYLWPDDEEYTCGVFTGAEGALWGTIALKRELMCGLTYRASVSFNESVIREAEKAAGALGSSGPCNVQLRLTKDGPAIFEINARFSSSTSIRARLGFNEARMALESFLLGMPPGPVNIRQATALRYWDEVIVDA